MTIGDEWLRHIKGCNFVQYNVRTTAVQGEIDVVGINLETRTRSDLARGRWREVV